MFRSKSQSNIGDSEREAKFVQERIDNVEKHLAVLCSAFAAYSRKAASLRDKNDEVAEAIQAYAESEDINRSTSSCLLNLANTLSVVGDYRDAEVKRIDTQVVLPLSHYQNTCRRAKENVKSTFFARDEELKKKRALAKLREENPNSHQRISQAQSNWMKATVEVSRVVKGLEEQIDSFEKQKLHDVKAVLLNFAMVQLSFHAKALELLTKAYQDVAEIDEAQDLKEFRELLRSSQSSTGPSSTNQFRQAYSLVNLHNNFSPTPTTSRKHKSHQHRATAVESPSSSKTGNTNSSESVRVEDFDGSTDDSDKSASVEERKTVRSRLKSM